MGKDNSITPMMEQYLRIKKNYKDALLFFRLGDFYELFFEDAKIASPVLEIALTSRQNTPMCGVPYHSVESYLAKLLRHGFKVAICEQVEDAKQAKGVVKRDVVKVLTPGTAVELELENEKENTFIASLILRDNGWGLAVIDLASGEIRTTQSDSQARKTLSDELFRFSPKEIAFPANQKNQIKTVLTQNTLAGVLQSPQEDWIFDFPQASDCLMDHFRVKSLAGFGLSERPLAVSAAGALLYYLKTLRKDSLFFIRRITCLQRSQHLFLDSSTIKNLELVRNLRDGRRQGSVLDTIDLTTNSMGGRLLKSWLLQPLVDCKEIEQRQDAVAEFFETTIERRELRECLKNIFDLERLISKISLSVANARDLVALKKSLAQFPNILSYLKSFQSVRMKEIKEKWDNVQNVVDLINRAIRDEPSALLTEGGIIREGYSEELDELRRISQSGKTFVAGLEKKERGKTGIASLKIRYNRVFGYYIDVTKPNLSLVPGHYIRKQTLVNSERFITAELKEHEEKILNAEERIKTLEYNFFQEIREKVARESPRIQTMAQIIASLDIFAAFAELAAQRNYCRPVVNEGEVIRIFEGRHPVIEATNQEPFVPNDTYIDREEDQILIITGPNMGGKSTYLRQVALICILAQMGSFVPAKEAEIGFTDRIFTRIGAMDFLSVGQSTFMVEMLEAADILNNATERSLILLDEIGRGTSTFDGLSLAWAIAEFLHDFGEARPRTLFATHYHELTELALTMERIKNYHVTVRESRGNIVFLRKIVSGPSDQSYGLHVAQLAGIPSTVIDRAREILFNLEKKELDDSGVPKIAYRLSKNRGDSQYLLFKEDEEERQWKELRDKIRALDIDALTPLDALNWLSELRQKIKDKDSD